MRHSAATTRRLLDRHYPCPLHPTKRRFGSVRASFRLGRLPARAPECFESESCRRKSSFQQIFRLRPVIHNVVRIWGTCAPPRVRNRMTLRTRTDSDAVLKLREQPGLSTCAIDYQLRIGDAPVPWPSRSVAVTLRRDEARPLNKLLRTRLAPAGHYNRQP